MRPVINFLSYFAELRNRPTTLLVSTTGEMCLPVEIKF